MNTERKQFMKTRKPVVRVLAVVLAFACIATAADAPKLHFKFTTINHPKALQTSPYGINNSGDIVGSYIDQKNNNHGFLLVNGKFTNIDDPKSTYGTGPLNVNSTGTIVGSYVINSSGNYSAFSYKNKKFTDVGPTFCTMYNAAAGINDGGEIVGWCNDASGVTHGWLKKGKKYSSLDYPGANNFTLAWGINNAGLVTLQWIDSSGNYEGATYNSKTGTYSTPINVPGAGETYIHSINNAGDIVFSWYVSSSSSNAYGALLVGKTQTFRTFSDPKSPDYTKPDGINDNHEIVGRIEPTGPPYEQGFKATYK